MKQKYLIILLTVFFFLAITGSSYATDDIIAEDYPVVREMEIRVYSRDFAEEDIYKRIERLETTLFGDVSQKSLSDRVDSLKAAVLGMSNNESNDLNSSSEDEESLKNLLAQMESQLMNQVYSDDPVEARVSRLENYIFNQSSESYPMSERIERIAAVVKAKPSGELNKDMAQLRNYQTAEQGVTLLALILMIVAGLAF